MCLGQTGLVSSRRANKKLEGMGFNRRHLSIQLSVVILSGHCRLSISAATAKRVWSAHSAAVDYMTSKPIASDSRYWSDKVMPLHVRRVSAWIHTTAAGFVWRRYSRCFALKCWSVWSGRDSCLRISQRWTCPTVCRRWNPHIRGFRVVQIALSLECGKKKVLGRCAYYYYYLFVYGAWGSVVVKALRYKSVESRWCHLIFQWHISFRPNHGPGVDSAPSENEYREYSWG